MEDKFGEAMRCPPKFDKLHAIGHPRHSFNAPLALAIPGGYRGGLLDDQRFDHWDSDIKLRQVANTLEPD